MEKIKSMVSKIKHILENKNKKSIFILILGVTGILLILFSELLPEENSEKITKNDLSFKFSEDEAFLEKRIEEAISKIEGAGETYVTITFESSGEVFYAKNSSENKKENEIENESEIVIIEGKNGDEPIIIKKKKPIIGGVLIVCDGGDNPLVKEKIIEGICALLDIPSNKVSVAKCHK